MRKIEQAMIEAVNSGQDFNSANTSVRRIDGVNVAVFLHGNEIATVNTRTGFVMVNAATLLRWPTNTTISRLRALGVNVYRKNHNVFLDNERVTK